MKSEPANAKLPARHLERIVLLALAACVAAGLAQPVLDLPERIGHNDNEGWNAFHAEAAMRGENPYPPSDALVSLNYPPLSFYVVGAVSRVTRADALLTGRSIALLALLVVAIDAAWIVSSITRSRRAATLAALLVLGVMGAHFPNYVAMNDPQLMGQALQFTGLAWFVTRGDRRGALFVTVALMLLGGLIKPNLLALPVGITVWLARKRRTDLGPWLLASAVGSAAAVTWLALAFGSEAFAGILGHARAYHVHLLLLGLTRWFVPLAPLLAFTLLLVALVRKDPREELLLWCAAAGLVTGLLMAAGAGVSVNAVFDVAFVAAISCAVVVHRLARDGSTPWVRPAATMAVASGILLAAPLRGYLAGEWFEGRQDRQEAARQDLEFAARHPGEAMCEDPAVCYWAGKSFEVDFFNLGQRLATGRVDPERLRVRIEERRFGVIQLTREGHVGALDESIDRALEEHYELARVSPVNGFFYVPRR